MRIDVSAHNGVVVVVPRGTPGRRVKQFVHEKREWIDRARDRVGSIAPAYDPEQPGDVPECLRLRAIRAHYPVTFAPAGRARVNFDGTAVHVAGGAEAHEQRRLLARWLKGHARTHLSPWLEQLSARHGFAYQRIAVRGQRTRWASCSGRGTISLNYKLLFLPSRLVEHVLLHELAHTRHLDHSPGFWRLLARLDPQAKRHHAALNRARRWLPRWTEID